METYIQKLLDPKSLLFVCALLHILADFNLQGCLAEMKQEAWWVRACRSKGVSIEKYELDWMAALLIHSVMWSLITFAPLLLIIDSHLTLFWILAVNAAIHAVTDHMKCNRLKINLWADQLIHGFQILGTLAVVAMKLI